MVIWLVGLSGAGKTSIGREVFNRLKASEAHTVFVDGDELRSLFGSDQDPGDYGLEGRRRNAERIIELCSWLDRQGINVVCAVLSIFEDQRAANRERFSKYLEVYVSAPFDELVERDVKGLYSAALKGTVGDVVGIQLPFEPPSAPDLILDNTGFRRSQQDLADLVMKVVDGQREGA